MRPGGAGTRASRGAASAALLAFACGCGPRTEAPPALLELERLAFQPRVIATGWSFRVLGAPAVGLPRPLLVDMYEATRADWLAFLRASGYAPPPSMAAHQEAWAPGSEDLPLAFVSLEEAGALARSRGMRLPTPEEWVVCAIGGGLFRRSWPWGVEAQRSLANTLELTLERPTPVGTFESGRTPQGCYDVLGNVHEWTTAHADALREQEAAAPSGDARVSAMGGSFRTHLRPIYRDGEYLALTLHPLARADDVGLRCVADAEEYLWRQAPLWGSGAQVRARLEAVGARWGRDALPLLDDLVSRDGAPAGLAALRAGAAR